MRTTSIRTLVAVLATLGLAAAAAGSASATTVCVVGAGTQGSCPAGQHPGGAITAASTNSLYRLPSSGIAWSCTNSTLSGTAPATIAATVSTPVTLAVSGCSLFGSSVGVSVPAACKPGGAAPIKLNAMWNAGTPATSLTIPAGCTITITPPGCTISVSGPQTIGNGTAGAGGQAWTNGTTSPSAFAVNTDAFTGTVTPGSNPAFCPNNGSSSSPINVTLGGNFTLTAPVGNPRATIQP
jgi:hypothetical protein